ncbi:MAG: hypothetical protein M1823_002946 [Watsoniomyces obsoletus]|nr:MAG: hypothetical protein M1823_002946 [Watsoniomyces obsoletus]
MAPAATTEAMTLQSEDLKPTSNGTSSRRTLLLSPPSLSARPDALNAILAEHDRASTDLQMLDRLQMGLVQLPESAYTDVLILNDSTSHRPSPIAREVLDRVFKASAPGGRLTTRDATSEGSPDPQDRREAILAGFVEDGRTGLIKPKEDAMKSVPLRFGKKKSSTPSDPPVTITTNGKRKSGGFDAPAPAGVGFVDFSDDLGQPVDDDDDLIDEDTLLDEEDLARPITQPPECRPKAGKRRRACKDCTCGLKEKIDAEDARKRSAADQALSTMKLAADDLAEIDFTVQGKVGSCGNCALGDAFRCDGCPYIGLPAFKPGEEVRLLNNDVQL